MLDENNIRKGFFEYDQFLAVRAALPEYLRGFVTIAYKEGWRLDEIETLSWDQVDRKLGIIRLEPGEMKNDDARVAYLMRKKKGSSGGNGSSVKGYSTSEGCCCPGYF